MKPWLLLLLLVMACSSTSANVACPVKETLAYSRETTSGIPGGKPIHVDYFIYVVLEPGAAPSALGVWIEGRFYAASLERVEAPVEIDRDTAVPTGEKDILVPGTPGDVYQVKLGDEKTPAAETRTAPTQDNRVVVFLKMGRAVCYGTAREIQPLRPAQGM